MDRPRPPVELTEFGLTGPAFQADHDAAAWLKSTFVRPASPLHNPDHAHLEHAAFGFLWTNVVNSRKGRRIVGQCEVGQPRGAMGKWPKARAEQQIVNWFGCVPDFIITLDAMYAADCADTEFCALVEHELYHAGQDRDQYGAPKFTREGRPVFAIRGHDIEEFVGVVRRYGPDASGVTPLIEAAKAGPQIAPASIARACGTCAARAA